MGKILFILLGVFFCLGGYSQQQVNLENVYYFSDFDGTLIKPSFKDKRVPHSFKEIFDTKIILYKVKTLPNLLMKHPEGPETLEISTLDIDNRLTRWNDLTQEYESLLSPNDGRIGILEKITLSDGRVIVPGHYYIKVPESMVYHRESPEGRNYLLEDFKQMESLETREVGDFRGLNWAHMVYMLSDVERAKRFSIITMRGHSTREWKEFFEYGISKGYFKYSPEMNNIHNVTRPEYQVYASNPHEVPQRKINLLARIIQQLADAYRLDGVRRTVVFTEDNQKIIEYAFQRLREFAIGDYGVDIYIMNAGSDFDVRRSRRSRISKLMPDGRIERANAAELFVQKNKNMKTKKNVLTCKSLFAGGN